MGLNTLFFSFSSSTLLLSKKRGKHAPFLSKHTCMSFPWTFSRASTDLPMQNNRSENVAPKSMANNYPQNGHSVSTEAFKGSHFSSSHRKREWERKYSSFSASRFSLMVFFTLNYLVHLWECILCIGHIYSKMWNELTDKLVLKWTVELKKELEIRADFIIRRALCPIRRASALAFGSGLGWSWLPLACMDKRNEIAGWLMAIDKWFSKIDQWWTNIWLKYFNWFDLFQLKWKKRW